MRNRSKPGSSQTERGTTGSPLTGEPVFLAAGFLRRAHGLKGEMIMDLLTDFPERLKPGKRVYVGERHQPIVIRSIRGRDKDVLIGLEGVSDPESAAIYRNQYIFVSAEELLPLPEGEYYHHQLIGLTARDESGKVLGVLVEILETGSKDVYLIKNSAGEELLVPAVDEFIKKIDLENNTILVAPPEWL